MVCSWDGLGTLDPSWGAEVFVGVIGWFCLSSWRLQMGIFSLVGLDLLTRTSHCQFPGVDPQNRDVQLPLAM